METQEEVVVESFIKGTKRRERRQFGHNLNLKVRPTAILKSNDRKRTHFGFSSKIGRIGQLSVKKKSGNHVYNQKPKAALVAFKCVWCNPAL